MVYWAGELRALQADEPASDRLADAADGLSVALLLLDVGVDEMLDAQRIVEPALAGLAATHGTAEHWDRLDRLIDESAAAIDEPDRFNDLSLAAHDLIAGAAGNRVLCATPISLRQVQARHYRDLGSPEKARAVVADHRELLAALRRRSSEAATHSMHQHLVSVRRNLDADGSRAVCAHKGRNDPDLTDPGPFARTTDETARTYVSAIAGPSTDTVHWIAQRGALDPT